MKATAISAISFSAIIAQLPHSWPALGIHGALIQRGCNQDTCPPHFRWRSPDGTGVPGLSDTGGFRIRCLLSLCHRTL